MDYKSKLTRFRIANPEELLITYELLNDEIAAATCNKLSFLLPPSLLQGTLRN